MTVTIKGFKYDDLDGNGFRGTTLVQGVNPDIVLILDSSGSTEWPFLGVVDVGNQNPNVDFLSNTVLDAEIAAAKSFHSSLLSQGFGGSNLALVEFFDVAAVQFNGAADQINSTGSYGFNEAAESLAYGGSTNFEIALETAENILQGWGSTSGNVIFLSDGEPDSGSEGLAEFRSLDQKGYNVQAFGVGADAVKANLDAIDSDGESYIFSTPEEVEAVLSGELGGSLGATNYTEPGLQGVDIYLDLNGDGAFDAGEPTAITDGDGNYEISAAVQPGTYAIKEKIPQGYLQTEMPTSITVSSGTEEFTGVNFGNWEDPNPPVVPVEEPPTEHLSILACFVKDTKLTIQFNGLLDSSRPATARFRVTVDHKPVTVQSASVSASTGEAFLILENPVPFGKDVRLSYTDLNGDDTFLVLQSEDGVDLGNITDLEVENQTRDDLAPSLTKASIDQATLTLSFDEELAADDLTNLSDHLEVEFFGRNVGIESVQGNPAAGKVILTLEAPATTLDDEITITYDGFRRSTNVIRDLAGNQVSGFTDEIVEIGDVLSDDSPLTVLTATVDGDVLELNFDREISDTKPSTSSFLVEADGKEIPVRRLDVLPNARQVILDLSKEVTDQETVTLSYTDVNGDQRTNVVEDSLGTDLASFIQLPVKNNSEDHHPLLLDEGEVIDPRQILLGFSKELDTTEPAKKRFKVFVDGKRNKVSSIDMNAEDGEVILNLKKDIRLNAEVIKVTYKDLAKDQQSNVIQDKSGNDLETIKNFLVENNLEDEEPPQLEDATAEFDMITLDFDEIIAAGAVKNSRFKVQVTNSKGKTKRNKVTGIEIPLEDTVVDLFLRKPINADDQVFITYKDPKRDQKRNVVQDEAGNDLESFRRFEAENITDVEPVFEFRISGSDDLITAMTAVDSSI